MIKSIISHATVLGALCIIISACANMNAGLSGGPKDVTPPKLVSSVPEMDAKNFNGKKIEINFDEFLKQTDIEKQLVISPPLKKKPYVLQRNKSILITLEDGDSFQPNTTYTFYFANSIQDLDEGNTLKNFTFVFSTGSTIDSLSLRGLVLNSFDHLPDKDGCYVMLYRRFEDSIPRKHLPDYVTRTDSKGYFNLTHLRADSFMIFALKDANQNMLFDQPNEMIAFSDTAIHINNRYYVPLDTTMKDTTNFDSLRMVLPNLKPQIKLFTFEEDHKKQYLSSYERPKPYQFTLIFNRIPYDSVTITPLNFKAKDWYRPDLNIPEDTLSYWITDTALIRKDTLKTIITFLKRDSIGKLVSFNDTIMLNKKIKLNSRQTKKEKLKKKTNEFQIQSPADHQEAFDLNKKVYFTATLPVKSINTDKLHLFKISDEKDKAKTPLKFTLTNDSTYIRDYWVNFTFDPNARYLFIADSAAFCSIYDQVSDSTGFTFKTQKDDYYGTLKLHLTHVTGHLIVQLLGAQDKVMNEKYTDADGPVLFDFLAPGKYIIKVIFDSNHNYKWDTGNFSKRRQPERVEFYKDIINVRSNWDIDQNWDLQ